MMDPQRQPTPQSVGMSQPSIPSPLGAPRMPPMSNGAAATRLTSMFPPSTAGPENGGQPVSGYAPMPDTGSTGTGRSQGTH